MQVAKPTGSYNVQEYDDIVLYYSGTYSVTMPAAHGSFRKVTIANLGKDTITVYAQTLDNIMSANFYDIAESLSITLLDVDLQRWIII